MTAGPTTGDADAAAPLVMVHGWGAGRHVWDPIVPLLARWRQLVPVDLPGCGANRPDRCGGNLTAIADSLLGVVPANAEWLGWSLGGLVAIRAASRAPGAVAGVTLLAASPAFVARDGWPGMQQGALRGFAREVAGDPAAALARFRAFQLQGGEGVRPALRALRAAAVRDGVPEQATLAAGLDLLEASDLRPELEALSCPVRLILGARDSLIPAELTEFLPALRTTVIDGAAHVPFATHPREVAEVLGECLN